MLPQKPWTFAAALLGEFLFQAISYTGTVALSFEAIGQNNPLAATTFTFLIAATNVPVAYMLYLDGRAYAMGGVRSSFAADALISIVVCVLIGWLLSRLPGEAFRQLCRLLIRHRRCRTMSDRRGIRRGIREAYPLQRFSGILMLSH